MIVGIDEVGRGPWAGPLVVGAVVLGGATIEGLTDSKKLTKKRREELNIEIYKNAGAVGLGWVDAKEIDEIGLSAALRLATRRALEQINTPYHEIIIDGTINFLADTNKGQYVTTLKKADLLIPSVSAASIVAKVARDAFMSEQHEIYPEYGFKSHVGYGTAAHRAAIEAHGVTLLHRLSFAPLAKYRDSRRVQATVHNENGFGAGAPVDVFLYEGSSDRSRATTTKRIGDAAETIAAEYLKKHGHEILERNWKTKLCEIDIISSRDDTIFFSEVKYRKKPDQGGGLAAITKTKFRQMKFAAQLYGTKNKLKEVNLRLVAISMTGEPPIVETFLEITEG
ncbi:MAG: ribonuclease HII [Candidatus Saccharibacteria bacterium]